MKAKKRKKLARRHQELKGRLAHKGFANATEPLLRDLPISYEVADRTRVLSVGGLGAIHTLVNKVELPDLINQSVSLLQRHLPYFESDHILSLCYHVLCGGKPLQDINRFRCDEVYLDALGVTRLPAPSTAGDFLRRFKQDDLLALQEGLNQARVRVWKTQPKAFFKQAIIDADGTIFGTDAQCKEGIDYCAYKRLWGYGPLLLSLANTCEPLYVVNRPASAPSHKGAAVWIDRALDLVDPHFEEIWLRGDTDFSLTAHFDKWDTRGVKFIFGYDAFEGLIERAELLPPDAWTLLIRPPAYEVKTQPRKRPDNVKKALVEKRGYEHIETIEEEVASFAYQPTKCKKSYRIIALKKHLRITKGGNVIGYRTRFFFYINNTWTIPDDQLVRFINQRCNQENTIEQLKNGVPAFHAPTNTLEANWAYMVIAALAWSLKAWYGLLIDHPELKQQVVKMEFKQFLTRFIQIPCQIINQGRQLVYRITNFTLDTLTFIDIFDNLKQSRSP